ncbi:MAG: hypothetical protein R3F47_19775 [Gammaproteobacteria bacterium]
MRFASGADLLNIDQLDRNSGWHWPVPPRSGVDARTLELIDSDGDGRIRANEPIAAVKWAGALLKNADDLLKAPAELPLEAINADSAEGNQVQARLRKPSSKGWARPVPNPSAWRKPPMP